MAKKEKTILLELRKWRDDGDISQDLYEKLSARYDLKSWDLGTIIRWTLVIGAVMLGIGLITFFLTIMQSQAMLALVLTLLCGLAYYFGFTLLSPAGTRYYPKSGNALVALACLILCADVFVLGDLLSTGSGTLAGSFADYGAHLLCHCLHP
jgi:uncharacterized membrane protein